MSELCEGFEKTTNVRVLVLGDIMLDLYTWGDAGRVSPEAPVLVLRAEEQEVRLGGAANVACLVRHLEAQVTLAGVVGDDASGRIVRKLLDEIDLDKALVLTDTDRCTTTKERFVGRAAGRHPHQILRVDRESAAPIAKKSIENRLLHGLTTALARHDALLISDYAKGVCTPRLLARVITEAKEHGIPVYIDPARITDYDRYRGATVLTPNRVERKGQPGCVSAVLPKRLRPESNFAGGWNWRRCFSRSTGTASPLFRMTHSPRSSRPAGARYTTSQVPATWCLR